METNTVLLSVTDYKDLIDFQTKIEIKGTVRVYHGIGYSSTLYLTKDDAVKEIGKANEALSELNELLAKKLKEAKSKPTSPKRWWQFWK